MKSKVMHRAKNGLFAMFKRKREIPVPVLYGNLMEGRTVVVTGGTQGIGFAIARSVLQNGGNAVITGRSQSKAENAREKLLEETGGDESRVFSLALDNTKLDAIPQKFSEIVNLISPLKVDALVNNAGIGGGGVWVYSAR